MAATSAYRSAERRGYVAATWSFAATWFRRGPGDELEQQENRDRDAENLQRPAARRVRGLHVDHEGDPDDHRPQGGPVGVREDSDRAGGHADPFAATADEAHHAGQAAAHRDGRGTRPAHPCTRGDGQEDHEHRPQVEPDEVDERVVDGGGRVPRQLVGGDGIEVDRPEDVERGAEQEHRTGDSQARRHQRPAPAACHVHRDPEQQQGDHRQDARELLEEAEAVLRLREVRRLEDRELGVDLGDLVGEGEAGVDQLRLDRVDDHREVHRDRVAAHVDGVGPLTGENGDELGVRLPVRRDPGVRELRGLDDARDPLGDEAVDAVGERDRQRSEAVGCPRRQPLGGQCVRRPRWSLP